MCGRGRWRCVREVEVCERGGGVWEGWRCVGEVETCVREVEVRW